MGMRPCTAETNDQLFIVLGMVIAFTLNRTAMVADGPQCNPYVTEYFQHGTYSMADSQCCWQRYPSGRFRTCLPCPGNLVTSQSWDLSWDSCTRRKRPSPRPSSAQALPCSRLTECGPAAFICGLTLIPRRASPQNTLFTLFFGFNHAPLEAMSILVEVGH